VVHAKNGGVCKALGHIDRQGPMLVAVDGNLSPESLKVVIKGCIDRHIHSKLLCRFECNC
jgi:hypothetical protein